MKGGENPCYRLNLLDSCYLSGKICHSVLPFLQVPFFSYFDFSSFFHSDFPHCATLSSGFLSFFNPIQVTNSLRVSRAHLSAWCIVGTYNFFVTIFFTTFCCANFFSTPFFCTTFFQKCFYNFFCTPFCTIFLCKFFKFFLNHTTDQVSSLHFLFFTIFQSSSSFRVTR